MAYNDVVQAIADAQTDAQSLSEFVFKPAGFKVARRLAPTVDTLQFYIDRFNSLNGDFSSSVSGALSSLNNSVAEADGKVAYIEKTVQDAINNTAVEGGVLADTFVTVTANGVGSVPRSLRELNSITKTLKGFGGKGGGNDDTIALNNVVSASTDIIIDTDLSNINQATIEKPVHIKGHDNPVLTQTVKNRHIIYAGYPTYSPKYKVSAIEGQKFEHITFKSMPDSDSDDSGALSFKGAVNGLSAFNTFKYTENALTAAGTGGLGKDTVSLCDYMEGVKRFSYQNFEAQYTRIIGLATHNNGDNTSDGYGGTNNNGRRIGLRLAGDAKGVTAVACNFRDNSTAVTHQAGSGYNVISGSYFENSRDTTISVTSGAKGRSFGNVYSGVIVKDAGGSAFNLTKGVMYRIDGLVHGTNNSSNTNSAILSQNTSGVINDRYYRIVFNSASGTVPSLGEVITQGSASATIVAVEDDNYKTISAGTTMPTTGEILVNNLTGDYFKSGLLSGISATATRVYAADGRHRIDATISETPTTGLNLKSDCNFASVLCSNIGGAALEIGGCYNIVDAIIDDNSQVTHANIRGDNNIIRISDNSIKSNDIAVRVYGNNNTIEVNCKNSVYVFGNNNNVSVVCEELIVSGTGNIFYGVTKRAHTSTGSNNNYDSLKGGRTSQTITATTSEKGEIFYEHGLLTPASRMHATYVGTDLKHIIVVNKKRTNSTSLLKLFNVDGTPLKNTEVTIDVVASI